MDATAGARVFFLTRKQNASLSPTDVSFSRASALGVALDVRARISDVAALAHRSPRARRVLGRLEKKKTRAFCSSASASNRSSDDARSPP